MPGRSLAIPGFDLGQSRLHRTFCGGQQAIDRRRGRRGGREELGTTSRNLRHEQQLDLPLQIGLGMGDGGSLLRKFLRRQVGPLLSQSSMPGYLRGEDVAGDRQSLVFGTESQPELRVQQSRDHPGLQARRLFNFRFGNERGGFAHLGIGPRADQPVDEAGQVKGDQSIHAGALFVTWRGSQQTGGLFCKTGLRFLQVAPVGIVTSDCLQAQGGLGLSRRVQFAGHDIRGFSESEL